MNDDLLFYIIESNGARVSVYDVYPYFFGASDEASVKLSRDLERWAYKYRYEIQSYRSERSPYYNPYPYARAAVEFLQKKGLVGVPFFENSDKPEIASTLDSTKQNGEYVVKIEDVGPEFDFSINERAEKLDMPTDIIP